MSPPSAARIHELVQNHWGCVDASLISVPDDCSLPAEVCADVLSILLARGLPPQHLTEECKRLFTACSNNVDLLTRTRGELCTLAGCSETSSRKIAARLDFQAVDSRPALAFCLQSVCAAIDDRQPSPPHLI